MQNLQPGATITNPITNKIYLCEVCSERQYFLRVNPTGICYIEQNDGEDRTFMSFKQANTVQIGEGQTLYDVAVQKLVCLFNLGLATEQFFKYMDYPHAGQLHELIVEAADEAAENAVEAHLYEVPDGEDETGLASRYEENRDEIEEEDEDDEEDDDNPFQSVGVARVGASCAAGFVDEVSETNPQKLK